MVRMGVFIGTVISVGQDDFEDGGSESNYESSGKKGLSREVEEVSRVVKGNNAKSMSAYERLRQKNVHRNAKLLGELGLVEKIKTSIKNTKTGK